MNFPHPKNQGQFKPRHLGCGAHGFFDFKADYSLDMRILWPIL